MTEHEQGETGTRRSVRHRTVEFDPTTTATEMLPSAASDASTTATETPRPSAAEPVTGPFARAACKFYVHHGSPWIELAAAQFDTKIFRVSVPLKHCPRVHKVVEVVTQRQQMRVKVDDLCLWTKDEWYVRGQPGCWVGTPVGRMQDLICPHCHQGAPSKQSTAAILHVGDQLEGPTCEHVW